MEKKLNSIKAGLKKSTKLGGNKSAFRAGEGLKNLFLVITEHVALPLPGVWLVRADSLTSAKIHVESESEFTERSSGVYRIEALVRNLNPNAVFKIPTVGHEKA